MADWRRYAELVPFVVLHPDEKWTPIAIEDYLKESRLIDRSGRDFPVEIQSLQAPDRAEMTLVNEADWTTEERKSLPPVCYIRLRNFALDTVLVDFYFLFGFNGGYWCGIGAHQADWEHVTLLVHRRTLATEKVYFSSHRMRDGYWKSARDCEWRWLNGRKRLVIYCARGAHGFYHRPATWIRFGCFANDATGRGVPFLPEVFSWDSQPWLQTERLGWGNWTTGTPTTEGPYGKSNTCCRRFWGCQDDTCMVQGIIPGDDPKC